MGRLCFRIHGRIAESRNGGGRNLVQQGVPAFLLLAIFGTVFAPALLETYGYAEDYWLLASVGYENDPMFKTVFFEEGRPLAGLLIRFAFSGLERVDQLLWIRFAGILGVGLSGWLVAEFMRRRVGAGGLVSLAVAAAAVFTAGGLLPGAWATVSFYPIAFVLSFLGGWRLMKAEVGWRDGMAVFLLLLVSLCIYQPMTGAVLLPLFLVALGKGPPPIRVLARPVVAYIASIGVYFIAWKGAIAVGWLSGGRMVRGGSLEDLFGNLVGFFVDTLPTLAAGPGYVVFLDFLAWIWLAGMSAWLLLELRNGASMRGILLKVGLGIVLLLLMAAPMIKSDFSPFRTLVVVGALVQVWPVMALLRCHRKRAGPVAVLVILFFAAIGGHALRKSFVEVHSLEYREGRAGIAEIAPEYREAPFGPLFARIPRPPQAQGMRIRAAYEYGNFTSSSDWAWSDFAKQHLAEMYGVPRKNREAFNNRVEVCPVPADFPAQDAFLLDYPAWFGVAAREDPGTTPNMSAWHQYRKTPLGWCRIVNEQWLWHELVGWGQLYGGEPPYPYLYSKWFGQLAVHLSEDGIPLRFFTAEGEPLSEATLRSMGRERFHELLGE